MKVLVVALFLIALAAAQSPDYRNVGIRYYNNDFYAPGYYRFAFEQTDGTRHEQNGELQNQGLQNEFLAVNGEYSWIAPNGRRYIVKYKADDNGYKANVEEGPGTPIELVNALLSR